MIQVQKCCTDAQAADPRLGDNPRHNSCALTRRRWCHAASRERSRLGIGLLWTDVALLVAYGFAGVFVFPRVRLSGTTPVHEVPQVGRRGTLEFYRKWTELITVLRKAGGLSLGLDDAARATMSRFVALGTQSDSIIQIVVSEGTPKPNVVNSAAA